MDNQTVVESAKGLYGYPNAVIHIAKDIFGHGWKILWPFPIAPSLQIDYNEETYTRREYDELIKKENKIGDKIIHIIVGVPIGI